MLCPHLGDMWGEKVQGGVRDSSWAQECGTPWEETLALMITEVPGISRK